jgi:hypothetical protein
MDSNRVHGGFKQSSGETGIAYLRLTWGRGLKPADIAGDLYLNLADHTAQVMVKQFACGFLHPGIFADWLEENIPNPDYPAFGYFLETLRSQS